MTRAIVRVSLGGGDGSAQVWAHQLLQAPGWSSTGPATYETQDPNGPSREQVVRILVELLDGVINLPVGAKLDHLWIYLDEPSSNREA